MYEKNLNGKFILIRHGETDYNFATRDKDYFKSRYEPKFFDTHLTQDGIKQAENASSKFSNLNIKDIYVSPYYRTLQTSFYLFKNHPQKNKIIIKVFPLIAENILGFETMIKDIDINKSKFNMNSEIKYDWSYFDNLYKTKKEQDLFYLNNVDNFIDINEKDKLIKNVYESHGTENFEKELINLSKRIKLKQAFETTKHRLSRAMQLKEFLKNTYKNSMNETDEKVFLVSHAGISLAFTSPLKVADEKNPGCDGVLLGNCEAVSLKVE